MPVLGVFDVKKVNRSDKTGVEKAPYSWGEEYPRQEMICVSRSAILIFSSNSSNSTGFRQ